MDPFGTSATLGHSALDAAGFIPGVGMLFDGMNALWYLAQGDWTNASLSAVALVPVIGDAAGVVGAGIKIVGKADDVIDAAKVAEKAADDVIEVAGKIPANPKKVSANYLKQNNIDPHTIKKDILGKNADIAKYDIFVDKNGDIWLQQKGSKEYIPTYENIER